MPSGMPSRLAVKDLSQAVAIYLGRVVLTAVGELGEFLLFVRSFFTWVVRPPFRTAVLLRQMEFIGVQSVSIVALTAVFTGMVFALQTGNAFRLFNAETLVGSAVGLSLTREIAPVFTALMVVARAGSAMAAEIGTMQVTEQVDALHAMAVPPIHFLVVPRVLASTVMVPGLAVLFNYIGILGAWFVGVHLLGIDEHAFLQRLDFYVDASDVVGGLFKAAIFGMVLALISCHRGYRTTGGAEGVGRATTGAVVISSVTILVLDYFLSSWIIEYFPEF